ncbi:MAG: metallophosphoesterase family protein, partial [Thermodesulfobacteriota bacterium]
MFILLISDIHGNYPALQAIEKDVANVALDLVINCGDSTVYGSFPNETLKWLRKNKAVSILGNTDRKVIKLLKGHDFKKPSKPEKRVMYTWTAEVLKKKNRKYLCSLPDERHIETEGITIGIFHGSPEDRDEFLFPDTDQNRFEELAGLAGCDIIVTGHSHTPFDKNLKQSRFIN